MDKLIMADGRIRTVVPKNGTDYTLAELQHFVDGYIQVLRLNRRKVLVINEEGKMRGLPVNQTATTYYRLHTSSNDFIVGNALLCIKEHVK